MTDKQWNLLSKALASLSDSICIRNAIPWESPEGDRVGCLTEALIELSKSTLSASENIQQGLESIAEAIQKQREDEE